VKNVVSDGTRAGVLRGLFAGLAALVFYGGWAFFVNYDYGVDMGIRAGLVQGGYSLCLTMTSSYLMELLWVWLGEKPYGVVMALAVTMLLLFVTAYGINYLAGTPEILLTIGPGFLIGSIYSLLYLLNLGRHRPAGL
jgi:hypothetical protein